MTKETEKTHFGKEVIPEEEKQVRVRQVFDSVAERYDLMNDLMSLGTHRLWKRCLAAATRLRSGDAALDVAGGTADLALLMRRQVGDGGRVVVYDINEEMLRVGRDKCLDKGVVSAVDFVQGDAEAIPFDDNTFHATTIGFGIRNVTRIEKALSEMERVTKPGGRVIVLEFSHPTNPLFSRLYDLYSENALPRIGKLITGYPEGYAYLHESIRKFPDQETFKAMMEESGLFNVKYQNLFNGIAALHIGHKI